MDCKPEEGWRTDSPKEGHRKTTKTMINLDVNKFFKKWFVIIMNQNKTQI